MLVNTLFSQGKTQCPLNVVKSNKIGQNKRRLEKFSLHFETGLRERGCRARDLNARSR